MLIIFLCIPTGTNLTPYQENYDNGFDNPFLKTLSPNWKGPRYWWLTSVKKDNFQTVFSNATSNLEIISRHLNLTERTGTENLSNGPSSVFSLAEEQVLAAFGNTTSTSFAEPSRLDNLPRPIVELAQDQIPPDIKPPPQCECLKHYQCFDNGTIKILGDGLLGDR